jgi:hypothetical protein
MSGNNALKDTQFISYIERSGDSKFEYLKEVEHAVNFKSNASPEFPEERMPFLQRFARFMCLDGENRPLGEREEEEK